MSEEHPAFARVLEELMSPAGLSGPTVRRVFDAIFAGAWTSAQIGGLLTALRLHGDRPEVIAAAASAMRARPSAVSWAADRTRVHSSSR